MTNDEKFKNFSDKKEYGTRVKNAIILLSDYVCRLSLTVNNMTIHEAEKYFDGIVRSFGII